MSKSSTELQVLTKANIPMTALSVRRLPIAAMGLSLGLFISTTYVLCVLFDLWFPQFAMHAAWSQLLPGFTWISWTSFFIGLAETFAYGWYIALILVPLYNFFVVRSDS